ncbi:MAG: hypothetical protein Q8P40_14245 [Nitrospirota bacterium]|nr:hypothetical protein [Nitrospirota bacterium]
MVEEKLNQLEGKLNQLDTALERKDKVIGLLAEENKNLKAQLKDDETGVSYAAENEQLIKQYLGKK